MKNADLPAMPIFSVDAKPGMVRFKGGDKNDSVAMAGLTKREMFAMHIMANTCWNSTDRNQTQHYQYAAESAVNLADALLKELEK